MDVGEVIFYPLMTESASLMVERIISSFLLSICALARVT
jgi:hypothetical protein